MLRRHGLVHRSRIARVDTHQIVVILHSPKDRALQLYQVVSKIRLIGEFYRVYPLVSRLFIVLLSTKPKQQSGSTFVPAPFEPCTFHSVICVVEFVCFCVNSCWSLCVRRRCFSSSFLFHHHHHALFTIFPLPGARPLPTTVSLPGAPPPLPHFGKFCAKGKVSRKEKKGKVPIYSKQKKGKVPMY